MGARLDFCLATVTYKSRVLILEAWNRYRALYLQEALLFNSFKILVDPLKCTVPGTWILSYLYGYLHSTYLWCPSKEHHMAAEGR